MKKSILLACLAGFGAVAQADHFSLTYDSTKLGRCTTYVEYYDGDKNRVTCSAEDKGVYREAGSSVTLQCPSGQSIGHLNDQGSGIRVKSNCHDSIKQIRAYKTRGKNKSKGAERFARRTNNDPIASKLSKQTHVDDCFKRVSIAYDWVRVLFNNPHRSDRRCKLTILED